MPRMAIVFLATSPLLLQNFAGCALHPAYERPAVASPAAFSARKIAAEAEPVWPSPGWWRVFGDAQLDGAVDGPPEDPDHAVARRMAQGVVDQVLEHAAQ